MCVKIITAPPSKNAVSAFHISCELLSFTLNDFWKKNSRRSLLFHNIRQYPPHLTLHIQSFTTAVDWPEILMEVSTMFYTCKYCLFNYWGRLEASHDDFTKLCRCMSSNIPSNWPILSTVVRVRILCAKSFYWTFRRYFLLWCPYIKIDIRFLNYAVIWT